MKILFVYNNELDGAFGGSQRTIQNLKGIKCYGSVDMYKFERVSKLYTFLNSLIGYIGNSSFSYKKKLEKKIKSNNYDYIFFDQTIHGKLVKYITKKLKCKCLVHYHNNDAEYYHDLYKVGGIKYLSIYLSAVINQNLSKKYAYKNIFITKEDSISVGTTTNAKVIIPITLKDKYEECTENTENYILYIGAATFANIEGAKYIITKLATKSEIQFVLIGKNLKTEIDKLHLAIPSNVLIFDYVESLSQYFLNASAFISPLFYGSGMKVKLAEALMYGKKILGTPLSFWGYDMTDECVVCKDESDFINEIKKIDLNKKFYIQNRKLFEEKYTDSLNQLYYKELFI